MIDQHDAARQFTSRITAGSGVRCVRGRGGSQVGSAGAWLRRWIVRGRLRLTVQGRGGHRPLRILRHQLLTGMIRQTSH